MTRHGPVTRRDPPDEEEHHMRFAKGNELQSCNPFLPGSA